MNRILCLVFPFLFFLSCYNARSKGKMQKSANTQFKEWVNYDSFKTVSKLLEFNVKSCKECDEKFDSPFIDFYSYSLINYVKQNVMNTLCQTNTWNYSDLISIGVSPGIKIFRRSLEKHSSNLFPFSETSNEKCEGYRDKIPHGIYRTWAKCIKLCGRKLRLSRKVMELKSQTRGVVMLQLKTRVDLKKSSLYTVNCQSIVLTKGGVIVCKKKKERNGVFAIIKVNSRYYSILYVPKEKYTDTLGFKKIELNTRYLLKCKKYFRKKGCSKFIKVCQKNKESVCPFNTWSDVPVICPHFTTEKFGKLKLKEGNNECFIKSFACGQIGMRCKSNKPATFYINNFTHLEEMEYVVSERRYVFYLFKITGGYVHRLQAEDADFIEDLFHYRVQKIIPATKYVEKYCHPSLLYTVKERGVKKESITFNRGSIVCPVKFNNAAVEIECHQKRIRSNNNVRNKGGIKKNGETF